MQLYVIWVDISNSDLAERDELTLSHHPFLKKILSSEEIKLVLSSEDRVCQKIAKALLIGKGYRLVFLKSAREIHGISELDSEKKVNSYLQGGFFPNVEGLDGVLQRTREVHRLARKTSPIDGAVALVLPKGFASLFLWKELSILLHPEDLFFKKENIGAVYFPEFPKPYMSREL